MAAFIATEDRVVTLYGGLHRVGEDERKDLGRRDAEHGACELRTPLRPRRWPAGGLARRRGTVGNPIGRDQSTSLCIRSSRREVVRWKPSPARSLSQGSSLFSGSWRLRRPARASRRNRRSTSNRSQSSHPTANRSASG